MKKIKLIMLLFTIFILTGCTSTITCKASYKDNIKYDIKISAESKDDKITSATAKLKFKDKDSAKEMCKIRKLLHSDKVQIICEEKKIIINNYQNVLLEVNEKSMSKKQFVERLEKDGYKC